MIRGVFVDDEIEIKCRSEDCLVVLKKKLYQINQNVLQGIRTIYRSISYRSRSKNDALSSNVLFVDTEIKV